MQQQVSYDEIVQTVNCLKFPDKLRLLNYLQRYISIRTKPVKKNKNKLWLGCLKECTDVKDDIVSPVMAKYLWEALSE